MSKKGFLACSLPLGSLGCAATVGTSEGVYVPKESVHTCVTQCAQIGMRLAAVAIMANNVGCACQAGSGTKAVVGAATTAGMATIAMMEAEAQEARQRQYQAVRPRCVRGAGC